MAYPPMTQMELSSNSQNGSSLLLEVIDLLIECQPPLSGFLGANAFATGSFLTKGEGTADFPIGHFFQWCVAKKPLNGLAKIF